MKTGVSITPWAVRSRPRRAAPSRASSSKPIMRRHPLADRSARSRLAVAFLRFEVVLDKGLDDFVDAGIGGEAQGFGAGRGERPRPARYDLLDQRVGLPANPGVGRLSADAAHLRGHLADRH